MTKRLISLFIMSFVSLATLTGFTACSDDDDDGTTPSTDTIREVKIDQLLFFQQSIVRSDSVGNLEVRKNGIPLTEFNADTTVVYLGVADLATAKTMFKLWLSADTKYIEVGDKITASPVDTLGNAQGTITFTSATEADADGKLLATVTFSDGASVPYVSQINFIKEEAWPRNSFSKYEVGDHLKLKDHRLYKGNTDSISVDFICLRRAVYGAPALFMGLTSYKGNRDQFEKYGAYKSDGYTIQSILNANWDFFAKLWQKRCGITISKDDWVLLNTGVVFVDAIQLGTGYLGDFFFISEMRHLLVFYAY